MQAVKDIQHPALRYYGGKWRLAPWIISHFPEHLHYVELCAGACSVLLQKPRSPLETINDKDGNIVNFFEILRDHSFELIQKIMLTPWARAEYEKSMVFDAENDIENARRFWVALMYSINGSTKSPGFKIEKLPSSIMKKSSEVHRVLSYKENLWNVAKRLDAVQIEHDSAYNIVERFDSDNTLYFFDPPYVSETRTSKDRYILEFTEADHIEHADILTRCEGMVVVSGYSNELYKDIYESIGWERVDKETQTNSGGKRVESLWLSPRTVEALAGDNNKMVRTSNPPRQMSLC